jgi:hypothetical protein
MTRAPPPSSASYASPPPKSGSLTLSTEPRAPGAAIDNTSRTPKRAAAFSPLSRHCAPTKPPSHVTAPHLALPRALC